MVCLAAWLLNHDGFKDDTCPCILGISCSVGLLHSHRCNAENRFPGRGIVKLKVISDWLTRPYTENRRPPYLALQVIHIHSTAGGNRVPKVSYGKEPTESVAVVLSIIPLLWNERLISAIAHYGRHSEEDHF